MRALQGLKDLLGIAFLAGSVLVLLAAAGWKGAFLLLALVGVPILLEVIRRKEEEGLNKSKDDAQRSD